MGKDVFSSGEAEYLTFATTFNAGVIARVDELGIPAALAADNTAKLTAYTAAYHAAEALNAGKIDREDRKEKREALTGNMRKIKKTYIDADPLDKVTPEIIMDFGLPPKDTTPKDITRTDVAGPAEIVPFTLESGEYLQVVVKHPARPKGYKGYNGAVARYKAGGSAPAGHKELTESKLLTRPREILTFEDADLGQTLYIALY